MEWYVYPRTCFSELALCKQKEYCYTSNTKRTSSSSHWNLTCSCHDIVELALNNNHSLTNKTDLHKGYSWNIAKNMNLDAHDPKVSITTQTNWSVWFIVDMCCPASELLTNMIDQTFCPNELILMLIKTISNSHPC